jgi:hypothetical protein
VILPKLPTVATIEERLQKIFPEGTPNRNYCTRSMAARTVFVLLYIGAIEGADQWLAPRQVTRMSDDQAGRQTDRERESYSVASSRPGFEPAGQRWYADNTREPIRDETLREGLVQVGAVVTRQGIPTTSSVGRYALAADFAALFDPDLAGAALDTLIAEWQAANLSAGALMRTRLIRRGAVAARGKISVTFPNGETRQLAAGPSSIIAKAVIEEFAPRYLEQPAVILLSESERKIIARDDDLARDIGLRIEAERLLPDIILVDTAPRNLLLVFVEVVATDGPVSESRKRALLHLASGTQLASDQIAFVTAFFDRDHAAFKRTVGALAWQSFAWFVAEPDHLILLHGGGGRPGIRLARLVQGAPASEGQEGAR